VTVLRVLMVVLLATGIAACGRQAPAGSPAQHQGHQGNQVRPAPVAEPVRSVPAGGFGVTEQAFVELSIATDDQAVKLADLGTTRAVDPTLRALAGRLGTARRAELTELHGLLDSAAVTYVNHHKGHDMPGMPTETELADLTRAGTGFDKVFAGLVLAHLTESATVAESAARQVSHAATKDVATRMARERAAALDRLGDAR